MYDVIMVFLFFCFLLEKRCDYDVLHGRFLLHVQTRVVSASRMLIVLILKPPRTVPSVVMKNQLANNQLASRLQRELNYVPTTRYTVFSFEATYTGHALLLLS